MGPTQASHNALINKGKESIVTRIRAHLMGHLPYTRLPDFDHRNPVSFCLQAQVNGIYCIYCRESDAADTMAH